MLLSEALKKHMERKKGLLCYGKVPRLGVGQGVVEDYEGWELG
jgi:hypothetical protein